MRTTLQSHSAARKVTLNDGRPSSSTLGMIAHIECATVSEEKDASRARFDATEVALARSPLRIAAGQRHPNQDALSSCSFHV